MKVKVFGKEMDFAWVFLGVSGLLTGIILTLIYGLQIPFISVFFGLFSLVLLVTLYYYWRDSRGYINNLGRIRRTFYTLYLLTMAIGFMSGKIDYANWKLLTQLTSLVVFVDLAVFQSPNILKIWSAEFKHEDEVREALKESEQIILKSAKKVEKFSEVITFTDIHFNGRDIPQSESEYETQLEEYLRLYTKIYGINLTLFTFPVPQSNVEKRQCIETQLSNISMRHGYVLPVKQEEKDQLLKSLSDGITVTLTNDRLIAIPYYGDFYCFLVTLEAKDVPVDVIDASHISNLLTIFDWYMTDAGEDEEDEIT